MKRIIKTIELEQNLHLENICLSKQVEELHKKQQLRTVEIKKLLDGMLKHFDYEDNLIISDKAVRANVAISDLLVTLEKEIAKTEKLNKKYAKEDSKNAFGLSLLCYSILENESNQREMARLIDFILVNRSQHKSILQLLIQENVAILDEEFNNHSKLSKIYKRNSIGHKLKVPAFNTEKDRGISGFKNDLEKSLLNDKKVKFLDKETLKKISNLVDKNFKMFEKLLMARYMFYRRNVDGCVTINLTMGDGIVFKFHHEGKLIRVKLNEL